MKNTKSRLDDLLVGRGILPSKKLAQSIIMEGKVKVDGIVVDKSGERVPEISEIEIIDSSIPYVSRGGIKLNHALDSFGIDVENKKCLDIGASTGGFTDCLLQRGAGKVFALDVGHAQLDWKLRNDDRVVCIERRNARYLKKEDFDTEFDIATIDVAFISIKKILVPVANVLTAAGEIVALIKPHFEAKREEVEKGGVVRDREIHVRVLGNIFAFCNENGIKATGCCYSPILGPAGNIEFFFRLSKSSISACVNMDVLQQVVDKAHDVLSPK